jgi:hypothetical protein
MGPEVHHHRPKNKAVGLQRRPAQRVIRHQMDSESDQTSKSPKIIKVGEISHPVDAGHLRKSENHRFLTFHHENDKSPKKRPTILKTR